MVYGEPVVELLIGPATVLFSIATAYLVGALLVKPGVRRAMKRYDERHLARPVSRVALYITVLFGAGIGLVWGGYQDVFGVLGTIIAAVTVAVGFAMKDTLNALVAGVFIFVDKPFTIGDRIEWGSHAGIVRDIRIRSTTVETEDNERLTVPNNKIANAVVKNSSARSRVRRTLTVKVDADTDVQKVKKVMNEVMMATEEVLEKPKPVVRTAEITGSAVTLDGRYWVASGSKDQYGEIHDELLDRIIERFDEQDITFS